MSNLSWTPNSEINHSCVSRRIGCLECITKNTTPSSLLKIFVPAPNLKFAVILYKPCAKSYICIRWQFKCDKYVLEEQFLGSGQQL